MLRASGKSDYSLSRCILAGAWLIVFVGAINYIFNNGPEIGTLAAAILTPASLAYAAREHTKRGDANA